MSDSTRTGLGVLAAALLLGGLGDALLRATPWGLNVTIWTLVLAAAIPLLGRPRHVWLAGPFVAFALATAWRDSPILKALDLAAAALCLAIAALPVGRLRSASLTAVGTAIARLGWTSAAGPIFVAGEDVQWSEVPHGRYAAHAVAAGRGLAIGLPLVLVFGGLFVAADAVFQGLVTSAFDIGNPLTHVVVLAACAWVAAGVLRTALVPAETEPEPFAAARARPSLGIVEACVVLGVLDVLFAVFVAVQFRSFFGGDAFVEQTTGLTYAAYARRGFFELVAVVALALPILIGGDWLVRRRSRRFRALASILVALLFVVMASALERMHLYLRAYGLTELRLYSTAFMLWLGAICCWFVATVLRGRRTAFAIGVVVSGLATVALLNVVNPDGLVARTNVDRPGLDAVYVTSLSADAVPTLVERLDRIDPSTRSVVARELLRRWTHGPGWRTWSVARTQAEQAVRSHRAELEAAAR